LRVIAPSPVFELNRVGDREQQREHGRSERSRMSLWPGGSSRVTLEIEPQLASPAATSRTIPSA
jgi:hypothetical protein